MSAWQIVAIAFGVIWLIVFAWIIGMWLACLVMEWRLRRWQVRDTLREADAILEVTERVRDTSPPLVPMFLAECVSDACEQRRDMGLS